MDTSSILKDLRAERVRIDRAISALEGLDGAGTLRATVPSTPSAPAKARGRRKMSPAGRKRISEMMKARWAERNATTALILKAAAPQPRGRRRMSAAARKRISMMMKKRWAARKKAGKTAL